MALHVALARSRIIHPRCDDDVARVSLTPVGVISRFPTISFSPSRADIQPSSRDKETPPRGKRHVLVFGDLVYFFSREIMSLLSPESRVVCSAGIAGDLEGIDKRCGFALLGNCQS